MKIRKNRLKELRVQSRLTQEEVAKLTDLHYTTVSKHESHTRSLRDKDIEKYAKLYKVSTYEIFISPAEFEEIQEKGAVENGK